MAGRILGAVFGAILFGILVPIVGAVWLPDYFESFNWFIALIALGLASGGVLGFLVPGPFRLLTEMFIDP